LKPTTRTGFLILPFEHIHDYRLEVSLLGGGLSVGSAVAAEIIQNDVDILIIATGHDRRAPIGLTHEATPRNGTRIKAAADYFVPASRKKAQTFGGGMVV
jgi:hypothetical protein